MVLLPSKGDGTCAEFCECPSRGPTLCISDFVIRHVNRKPVGPMANNQVSFSLTYNKSSHGTGRSGKVKEAPFGRTDSLKQLDVLSVRLPPLDRQEIPLSHFAPKPDESNHEIVRPIGVDRSAASAAYSLS